ncbi:MAG: portal protein, partial [Desulfovibrio sp.]|uniref:portal protein n=1 Tax=Desulfovibrio sp. TaxID=885 RepID=UPI002A91790C
MAVDVNELARRYEALRTERSGWDTAWRSLAELFLPCRWRSDTDTTAHQSPKLNGRLVNSAGVLAMRTLAAGMQGGMTSPVRPWFRLTTKGDDIAGMPGLNAWLEEVTSRMQRVLHESNFYNAVHGLYADLGTFGTGLLIETADEDGIHFHLIRAGEYVLDVNGRNEVDTFFRRLNMTARQIVDRWGEDRVPDAVRNVAKRETGQGGVVRFDVIHGVFPRRDAPGGLGGENKPFASVYWLQAAGGSGKPCILSEGGFDSFP